MLWATLITQRDAFVVPALLALPDHRAPANLRFSISTYAYSRYNCAPSKRKAAHLHYLLFDSCLGMPIVLVLHRLPDSF